MKPKFTLAVIVSMLLLVSGTTAMAGDTGTFRLTWENDAFTHNDRYYTNGFRLNWVSPDLDGNAAFPPAWVKRLCAHLPPPEDPESRRALSLSLGQSIYTPKNLEHTDLIRSDRPYAGMAYLAAGFHSLRLLQKTAIQIGR